MDESRVANVQGGFVYRQTNNFPRQVLTPDLQCDEFRQCSVTCRSPIPASGQFIGRMAHWHSVEDVVRAVCRRLHRTPVIAQGADAPTFGPGQPATPSRRATWVGFKINF